MSNVYLYVACGRFIVVSDSKRVFNGLVSVLREWPEQLRSKVRFQYEPLWYPKDRAYMRNMFRECATERLFVPAMLPQEDAVIYIDTDFIFMRPPQELWAMFETFNEDQVAAMAPCLYHYGTSRKSKVMIPRVCCLY